MNEEQKLVRKTHTSTFWANIYCGLKPGYDGVELSYDYAERVVKAYVQNKPMCVSFTKTKYIYENGEENGVIIGIINYPRFPLDADDIRSNALFLANHLKEKFCQIRVTVMFPNETLMLGDI